MSYRAKNPVALFIYNRPDVTSRVFEAIRRAKPKSLYVIADGPRDDVEGDEEKCNQARRATESVDWDCSVHREYASTNLGLKNRFITGLEVIFSNEPRAIILEDDCVPNPDFFQFCDLMLERYEDDTRIWDVSGTNHLQTWKPAEQDYHFSHYGGIWGWATWRRAWEEYDPKMELWEQPTVRRRLRDVVVSESQYQYLRTIYQRCFDGRIETWDYQWGFARHINSGLSVIPSNNLVTNIGFGEEATNTTEESAPMARIPRSSMEFPISFKNYVVVDREYDKQFHKLRTSWWERQPILRRLADKFLLNIFG